ncbi:MAG: NAD(P)-dependent alcohol dehydrogenase [Cohaesibacteraceae bacterium]|nr:NAD(P)-dependent alcohol dehydrogenase [Cohaesibacteraceae bacterium]MBL4876335.1 NAD(P)-dependent alcohol dehydrogenase [Cohaesibacteraceae bacterium]
MRAIVYRKYGSPDVLHLENVDKPVPEDNEILIRVHAAEATKSDCEMRSFKFAVKWFWLPLRLMFGVFRPKKTILGGYFSGEVEAVGKGVTGFSNGDQIFGSAGFKFGAYAEYMCLPENSTIAPKPSNISFEEAAAVPLGALNAIHFLNKATIKRGDSILINGAGGSIGTFAVQIAKAQGAIVTAVDSSIKEEMLRQIGADHFIDYKKQNFAKSGKTHDVLFSMVAGISSSECLSVLKPDGRLLLANPRIVDMLRSLITNNFSTKNVDFAFAGETRQELLELKTMIEDGIIHPVVDRVYPMEQAAEAHHTVESEQRLGTIVIAMRNS